jgi:hypothetical protein
MMPFVKTYSTRLIYDADAIAFINAGAFTNTKLCDAIDFVVKALKGGTIFNPSGHNLWALSVIIYLMVTDKVTNADKLFQFKWNLKNAIDADAANRLVYANFPNASIHGIKGNGVSMSYNTFMTPTIQQAANDTHRFIYSRQNLINASGDDIDAGADTDTGNMHYSALKIRTPSSPGNMMIYSYSATGAKNYANLDAKGAYLDSRIGNNFFALKNEVVIGNDSAPVSGSLPSVPVYGLALNLNNSAYGHTAREICFHGEGFGLTLDQALTYQRIINEFQRRVNIATGSTRKVY